MRSAPKSTVFAKEDDGHDRHSWTDRALPERVHRSLDSRKSDDRRQPHAAWRAARAARPGVGAPRAVGGDVRNPAPVAGAHSSDARDSDAVSTAATGEAGVSGSA